MTKKVFHKYVVLHLFLFFYFVFYGQELPELQGSGGQKDIYITLDVSGSMTIGGNQYKYLLGSYAAQVIQYINDDSNVKIIVGAEPSSIDQIKNRLISRKANNTEIQDIRKLNEIFHPEPDKNYSIIIIGDGAWEGSEEPTDRFIKLIDKQNVNVTFLQTLTKREHENTIFRNLINNYAKIYTTRTPGQLINSLDSIIEEVSGVSALENNEYKLIKGRCVVFVPDIDLNKIKLLYQNNGTGTLLPNIVSVTVNGRKINNVRKIGMATNKSICHRSMARYKMSSVIYKIIQKINAGDTVKLCFDRDIDKQFLKLYPIHNNFIDKNGIGIAESNNSKTEGNIYYICNKKDRADILVKINNTKFLPKLIARSDLYIRIAGESKKYPLQYLANDKLFKATIPVSSDKTIFWVEGEIGYTRWRSPNKIIERDKNLCKPKKNPPKFLGRFKVTQKIYRRNGYCIMSKTALIVIDKQTGKKLNPGDFRSFNKS